MDPDPDPLDPFHLAGSGSVSDDPDPDPGPGVKFVRNCLFSSKILTNAKLKMQNFFQMFKDLSI